MEFRVLDGVIDAAIAARRGNAFRTVTSRYTDMTETEEALIDRRENVTVKSDSELMTKQLRGEYRVKNENLKPYYEQFLHLCRGFNKVEIVTIDRKENSVADKLANKAVDSRIDSSLKTE